uniref:L-fuculose 1-phosphate aldolase n=1 Tax=Candidatus Kentrum sp. MB TaxID=2138164 RepID=A0A450WYX2_9GAMM|nr:MAG: L-fuculose 1-phosphate aldolase [Candidatus Kentron sp. MB]VFK32637.1 MAG: L-fuculose 1-phosphate aldolase [Candidatus Kentron sp. MB]VFK76008.1 MAG: L-fuculose 1-phosphate aldolase [Candidatus Kentron sp. MB]
MNNTNIRQQIIDICRKMNHLGLNQGSSGNASLRVGDGFLITPSGLDYDAMEPTDIVAMDFEGDHEGRRAPSSEWRIHRDILHAREDIQAVIHAHSMFCTTLAIHGRSIPAVHYLVVLAGGDDIPCVPYATPTTQALSDVVLPALMTRRACLMAHHGVVVTGATLQETFNLLVEVENLAAQYWRALQIGKPPVLNREQIREMREIMKTYGGRSSERVDIENEPISDG